jgi:FtsP/CotA-like multicopper oxidase with cupredoxin domain
MSISRREFMLTSVALASVALTGCAQAPNSSPKIVANSSSGRAPRRLIAESRSIDVNGRAASVLGLRQPDGTRAFVLEPGERFNVEMINRLSGPTIVHWHGQVPPANLDGVSQFGVPELQPDEHRLYDFAARPGTYWMHSHHGFQEQRLLAAPLIVRTPDNARADVQEVTVFLEDFLFRDPAEVMEDLRRPGRAGAMGAMHMSMPMSMDLNDVDFDAYLANDRTLDDPEVVRVEPRARVRLRIINGASSTNFHILLGQLQGSVVAVDGNRTQPLRTSRFSLAMAQRVDILVDLPDGAGAWPILAVREGDRQQTGIVLATHGADVGKVATVAPEKTGAVSFDQELSLSAATPLTARAIDARFQLALTGSMHPYVWGFNGKGWDERDAVMIRTGERVAITFHNTSMMSHPIHLHGHHFQVIGLNDRTFAGALRDTVVVPPMATVTVAFDADNAGRWLMHCHNLYHMQAGMMTEVAYA